jgi:hypothetical protein
MQMLGTEPSVGSTTFWLIDIRKVALAAGVAAILSDAMSISRFPRQSLTVIVSGSLLLILFMLALFIIELSLLVFLFMLGRSEGIPRISQALGWLALGAAFLRVLLTAPSFLAWIGSLGAHSSSVLFASAHRWTLGDATAAFAWLSNLASIWLLVAFFFSSRRALVDDVSISRSLRIVALVAAASWALWISGQVVLNAYQSLTQWDYFLKHGLTQAQMISISVRSFQHLLTQATTVVAPFIIYKSATRLDRSAAAVFD